MSIQRGHRLVLLASCLAGAGMLPAPQSAAQSDSFVPLFASNDPVELTLAAPMKTLVNRRTRRPDVDATITYAGAEGTPIPLYVEVTTRGHSRLEVCSFPPLRLNFRRREVPGTLFAGQNRLKLVTQCRDNRSFEQYLQLEYLVYRILEQVTDRSFKVRPVHMRYIDTDRRNREEIAPGFLIEDIDGVAARVGLEAVDVERVPVAELDKAHIATVSIFQYLIGNTDWSAQLPGDDEDCCHNHGVIATAEDTGPYFVIPYDFDQAGIINPSYAAPDERLPIRRVTQHLYRGFCAANDEIPGAIDRFNAARPAIEALFESPVLTDDTREDALEYLAEGFAILNDPEERQSEILDACRGTR